MSLIRPETRQRAARQERLLTAVERDSDKITRRFTQAFNRRAEYALRRGQPMTLLPTDRQSIQDVLLDTMVEAYVKRYSLEKKMTGVELGFSALVRHLAKQLQIDLGDIRRAFEWFTRRNVDMSLQTVENRINSVLSQVVSEQLPTYPAVREMRRRLEKMGISVKNPNTVETLVRTHSQMAFGAAQWRLDQDDPANLIWGYTYYTVGDARVREEHAEMEGVTRPKDDPIWDEWWPPNGWNCRCQLVAVMRYENPKASRAPKNLHPDEEFRFNPGKLLAV